MTDRDREDLVALATDGLSFWKAHSLRRRIVHEPELAQEWEAIQALYGQLRTMANVHPVPATPVWSPTQDKRPIGVGLIAIGVVAVAMSALVISWVAYNLITPKTIFVERPPVPRPVSASNLYNAETAPEPIPIDPRRKSRTVEGVGMVAGMNTKTNMAWKILGNVRVKVTYFDGTSQTLVSAYTENKALMKRLQELGIPFSPKDTPPIIRWSRGKRIKNKLTKFRPLEALPDGVTRGIETWVKREADGRMEGYGTHEIKDGQGKVLATLVVEPLPVQLRHDRAASHRRAEK